jgi:hypothetical protein
MSNLNDYSDKDSFEFLCNNEEQINSCDVHVDISADEQNPNNLLSQSDPQASNYCQRIYWIWLKN